MKINEMAVIEIKALDDQARGIGYVRNEKIIVPFALKHEKIKAKITKKLHDAYLGEAIEILEASPLRQASPCPYFKRCGSCRLLHMEYAQQLAYKKQHVLQALRQEQLSLYVHDVEGMAYPYAYRNKIIVSFKKDGRKIQAGFYEEYSHRIVSVEDCLLQEPLVNDLIEKLKSIVKETRIDIYDEDHRTGFLRHILIRRGMKSNQTMVVIVGAETVFKAKNAFVRLLKERCPEVDTLIFNYNPRKTSTVLGEKEQILFGKGFIEDQLCQKTFRISSRSFYQINPIQCEKLYQKAIDLLDLKPNETILDAYCGIGTIGILASHNAKAVLGVEINPKAIQDALVNARINFVGNIRFVCADAGEYMQNMSKEHKNIDALIMDPTREGSDSRFISSLLKLKPKKIVYISCNPDTQIRDLKALLKNGYQAKEMFLYDMFPHTLHVESIVLLTYEKRARR